MSGPDAQLDHVEWSRSATLYQVNIRQFTVEGTFRAFEAHLPRLAAMGVEILYLMPIHPIGEQNRKGTLGSAYAVRDYFAVNPEFGSLADFRQLVRAIHASGMHVIIDWVANHTAWDHPWITLHPDWYRRNAAGELVSYNFEGAHGIEYWTDVVGLDFAQPSVWSAMTEALAYWVREADIDGYRCDVAGLVPTAFWERTRSVLDAIKPVFMLAEWSDPALHVRAFDMTYDWDLYDALTAIAQGRADATVIPTYVAQSQAHFPRDAYRMLFTSNHDKNAWVASDTELYGDRFRAFAVLAATLPGMPLIYGGQESILDKRLAFFEKDDIVWRDYALADFYSNLIRLKQRNPALWNGARGGGIEFLPASSPAMLAFRRVGEGNVVTVLVNLSGQRLKVADDGRGRSLELAPWAYLIRTD